MRLIIRWIFKNIFDNILAFLIELFFEMMFIFINLTNLFSFFFFFYFYFINTHLPFLIFRLFIDLIWVVNLFFCWIYRCLKIWLFILRLRLNYILFLLILKLFIKNIRVIIIKTIFFYYYHLIVALWNTHSFPLFFSLFFKWNKS